MAKKSGNSKKREFASSHCPGSAALLCPDAYVNPVFRKRISVWRVAADKIYCSGAGV